MTVLYKSFAAAVLSSVQLTCEVHTLLVPLLVSDVIMCFRRHYLFQTSLRVSDVLNYESEMLI